MATNNVILVTASYDKQMIFWDATSGQCVQQIDYEKDRPPIPGNIINRIEVSADKKYLGAACSTSAQIYDIEKLLNQQHMPLQTFDGYTNNVTQIGFQKDCKWIYACSEDGTIKIHDFRQTGYQRCYTNKEPINSLVLHPNEAELIAGDQQGNIKIFDLQYDKCRAKLVTQTPSPDIGIRSLSIAENASLLVAADSSGVCHVYELKNTEDLVPLQKLEAHNDYILKCLISPDVKKMATCSADKTIKLWNFEKGGYVLDKTLYGHSRWVWDCIFSCDTDLLITVSSDTVAKIWKTDTGDSIRTLKGHKQGINCVALNDAELQYIN